MTLDEAICKEEALAYSFGERYKRLGEPVGDLPELEAEHKQYAEWLKELKAYRKAKKKIIENMKAWEKIFNEPLEWNVEDINSIKLAFYQDGKADAYTDCIGICEIAFEEVNADDT